MKSIQKTILALCAAATLCAGVAQEADAGTIVVANDEWTLSDTGFSQAGDTGTFATNVAALFSGGGAGSFHAYSSNFGLTGASLATALSSAGHTYASGTGITWDLATLQGFDGIFLAGTAVPDVALLTTYVNAGGNVYLAAGTGTLPGGAAGEAAYWNAFLGNFGLGFGSPYNGVGGNQTISSAHPIFSGVSALYQNNGNDALDINIADTRGRVLVTGSQGQGLYAIYESGAVVPLPGAAWMGLALLGGLGIASRRRRRS